MSDDDSVRLRVADVVHELSTDFEDITLCGLRVGTDVGVDWQRGLTLDATNCMTCLANVDEASMTVYYRCDCSWVGSDPDYHRRQATCPACWHHDRKRVFVSAHVS